MKWTYKRFSLVMTDDELALPGEALAKFLTENNIQTFHIVNAGHNFIEIIYSV